MNNDLPSNAINILLVEDNPADVRLTEEALHEGKLLNSLHVVEDGEEALDFLFRRGRYSNADRPHLVLLDLNLPKIDGHAVLAKMKADESLKSIPVVVLTTSQSEEDKERARDLKATSYITKPIDMQHLIEVVRSTQDFWISVVAVAS